MHDIEIHQTRTAVARPDLLQHLQGVPINRMTCIMPEYKLSSVLCAPALTCELLFQCTKWYWPKSIEHRAYNYYPRRLW